jgi:RHS repeat-associated protein
MELKDHAGRITTYRYDANHPVLRSVTDPAGAVTKYDYILGQSDILNYRLTDVDLPGHPQEEIRYQYRSDASIWIQDDEYGNVFYYWYDPDGRTHIRHGGGISTMLVNERGQPIEVLNPLGATTHCRYDAAYNLTQVTNPLGYTYFYQYDEYGNPTQITDPKSNTIHLDYDLRFHKISSLQDPLGNTTTFEYDPNGNLARTIYPDTTTEEYDYDSLGNITSKKNRRGETITYSYNSQGQLVEKKFPDDTNAVYAYDPNGNMTEASHEATTIKMAYDKLDRLIRVEYPGGFYFKYEYDGSGRMTRRTDQDGRRTDYHYGIGNKLLYIEVYDLNNWTSLVWYSYYADTNRLYKKWFPTNGVHTIYEYDDAGQLLHLINYDPNDNIISQFDYTYDLVGNRLTMSTLEGLHQYAYDELGQLTEVTYPDGRHVEYKYDSAGNRIQVIDNNSVTSYMTNNLNQYTDVGGYACTYDLNGNLTQRVTQEGTFDYQYDSEDRLIAISGPNQVIEYAYDPFGQRIRRTSNGAVTNFIVEPMGLGNVVAEYDAEKGAIAYYDYGYGLLSRTDNSDFTAYYTFDALGSTSEMSDPAGRVLNRYSYDAFGEPRSSNETLANPFQYLGEYGVMDEKNGLLFMRARFYDPRLGRFLTRDPVGLSSFDTNAYGYCANNPVRNIDPSGLQIPIPGQEFLDLLRLSPEAARTFVELQRKRWRYYKETGFDPYPNMPGPPSPRWEGPQEGSSSRGPDGANAGICPTFIQPPQGKTLANPLPAGVDEGKNQLIGKIILPINGCLLRSDIPIYGIAGGTEFKRYRVEYGEGNNPTQWHVIEESNEPQVNPPSFKDISWMQGDLDLRGNLATWNVGLKNWSHLPWHPPEDPTDLNGAYTIRLVVEGKDGIIVENRVTCEVGRAIAQCLPGIAISPDKRVIMRFSEQSLTHPFRVYTILPLSDVGEEIPPAPKGCEFIGLVYRIREPGDKFAKDVTLEFNPAPEEVRSVNSSHLGICCYDVINKEWLWLVTEQDEAKEIFSTVLAELPTPKAVYVLAFDPAAERSTIVELDVPSPMTAKPVGPGVLLNCTFEDDFGTFKPRDRFVGAKLLRDNKSTPDNTYCLKLINENHGGNFSCTVLDKSFDAIEYPDIHFDYRIGPGVKIDFLLKVNGRWYRLRFTGDEIDYHFRDVNIDNLGTIPKVVTDNKWHTAAVDLLPLLRQKTRHTRVDEIVLADWIVGGFMKLDFGYNRRGASFCIELWIVLLYCS